jgi:hypothetical protein
MNMPRHVKAGFCAVLLAATPLFSFAADPDAQDILRAVRLNQSGQDRALRGRLRTDDATIPFQLVLRGAEIRYEFSNPAQTIVLRLGEKNSQLLEETSGGTRAVAPAGFDKPVRDTDITYEDLALRFLYWPKAKVDGEDTLLTRRCWKLHLEPGGRGDSQYSVVILWVEKESGAFLRADGYDWDLKLAKRFEVRSVQKSEGVWILKQMRIQRMDAGARKDASPTYLEIQK